MALQTFTGDISKFLGRELIAPEYNPVGAQIGDPQMFGRPEFIAGGDIYRAVDTGRGTRIFERVGSLAERQAADFAREQRERSNEFLGRFRNEVPTAFEAVRQELGVPTAFETFGQAGDQVRTISNTVRDLPRAVELALQGTGASTNRLAGRQAAEIRSLQPAIESATRGLESSQAGLSNVLSEFDTRTKEILAPFELEANLLSASTAAEFDLFKQQASNQLDRELANLSRQTQLDLNSLERAEKLAQIEQKYEGVSFAQDLGDRIGLFDRQGNLIRSETKGLAPSRAGVGTIADGW